MPVTRVYCCTKQHVVFEVEQRITDGALKSCSFCNNPRCIPKRLISGGSEVHFIDGDTGGWSNQGYSKPLNARRAESILGRKLRKSEK